MLDGSHRAVTNVDKERVMARREAECADDGLEKNDAREITS